MMMLRLEPQSGYKSQESPTFLAPGTNFVEDNFSMDEGGGGWFPDALSALHSSSPSAVRPGT